MIQHVVSILRTPSELSVQISRSAGDDQSFETISVPLSAVPNAVYPGKELLQASWNNLSEVDTANEDALFDIAVILQETVPARSTEASYRPLPPEWNTPPKPVRATSAHPRAFKGTKSQPQKRGRLSPIDIRPYLCNLRSLREVIEPLTPFLTTVQSRLLKAGYDPTLVDREVLSASPRKAPWSFPALFVQLIWPSIRNAGALSLSQHMALFLELDLEHDDRLRNAFTRILALQGKAAAWGRVAAGLETPHRATLLEKVIKANAHFAEPPVWMFAHVDEIIMLADSDHVPLWIEGLLQVYQHGVTADYLMAGLRLSAQFNPARHFEHFGHSDNFPLESVLEIGAAFPEHESWLPLLLWERCGRFPGLADWINSSQWRSFDHDAGKSYFQFLAAIDDFNLPEARLLKKWRAISAQLPRIEALIVQTSMPYQQKVVECIADWLSWWDDDSSIRSRLHGGYRLLQRLAAPPFPTKTNASGALGHFLELGTGEALDRFLATPDSSFEVLDRACRRDNDATLISRGLRVLTPVGALFTVDAFVRAPAKLARVAKSLGSVSAPVGIQLLKQCLTHPLFQLNTSMMLVRELSDHVTTYCANGLANPIPSRLSAWLRGEIELSQAQVERHRRVILDKLLLTRLDLIDRAVVNWMKRDFPLPHVTSSGEHALRMLNSVKENKRGLRKFLRGYWTGDEHYLAKHPETLAWYRKHKAVSRATWELGIPFQSGALSIEVEKDPLEVLKLGTYVGTCLGLGGAFADSAIAALLDVNKQVLYARDQRGRVLARQLVAVSDDDRLICFPVYPHNTVPPIKALFRDYDRAFAQALRLPLYEPQPDDAGYQISLVLANYWWDDFSWDFETS